MMAEMNPGDVSPTTTRDEVVVLMSKEEPRPQQDPQVATLIPKNDVQKTKETSKAGAADFGILHNFKNK